MNFKELNQINVTSKVEKKNGFSYLSWAFAWQELKNLVPDATYRVYENSEGLPFFKSEEGYFVKVSVTANGQELISYLPVMDLRNKALKQADTMDINKAIQRCLVKAIALHGIGLYLYTGEDLPETAKTEERTPAPKAFQATGLSRDIPAQGSVVFKAATTAQVGYLKKLGFEGDVTTLTSSQANDEIKRLQA